MKLETLQYADVSTAYLQSSDLGLLLDTSAPGHLANLDNGEGSIFYVPEFDQTQLWDAFAQEAREFGFSERFVEIMLAAYEQHIPYVRFDCDGRDDNYGDANES